METKNTDSILKANPPRAIHNVLCDVTNFHIAMQMPIRCSIPYFPQQPRIDLRLDLVQEEVNELATACRERNLPEVADAIVDAIYVLVGMGVEFGIPIVEVWDAVQAANMAKVGGPKRADGKQLKPAGWKPADVAAILRKYGWEDPEDPM